MTDEFEQISLLPDREKNAYLLIRPDLRRVLQENGMDDSQLSFQPRKGYGSVLFGKSVVCRIYDNKVPYITIPTDVLARTEIENTAKTLKTGYSKITLVSLEQITDYSEILQSCLQSILDSGPNAFDCCSRVQACSDAKRCVHSDRKLALRCGYRKILKSGRIFYGSNRNVD